MNHEEHEAHEGGHAAKNKKHEAAAISGLSIIIDHRVNALIYLYVATHFEHSPLGFKVPPPCRRRLLLLNQAGSGSTHQVA